MCALRNVTARSCNHGCKRKAISIKYSECVFLPWDIQHAMRMRHINSLWPSPLYNISPHCLINGTIFEGKNLTQHKMSILQRLSETFLILRKTERDIIKMYTGLQVKYPLFLSGLMTLEISRQIFEKLYSIKFHENQSSGSRVVPCGRMEGRTDRYDEGNSRLSQFCESTWKQRHAVNRILLTKYIRFPPRPSSRGLRNSI